MNQYRQRVVKENGSDLQDWIIVLLAGLFLGGLIGLELISR